MLHSTLTDQGQTTIPVAVRKALHLKPRQRLSYEFVEGGVLVKAEPETLMELAGSLKTPQSSFSDAQIQQVLQKEATERYLEHSE